MPVCIALLGSHLGERVGEGGTCVRVGWIFQVPPRSSQIRNSELLLKPMACKSMQYHSTFLEMKQ